MLKIAGAILVIGASTGIGFHLSRRLKLHLEALLWIKKMVTMLKGEILYLNAPLEEAFYSIAERIPKPYSGFLNAVSERLGERNPHSFYDIWSEEIKNYFTKGNLSEKDIIELKAMGENLGYLDRQMQEKTLNLYLEQIEQAMVEGKAEFDNKSKIYRSLGVMGGILITIVMI